MAQAFLQEVLQEQASYQQQVNDAITIQTMNSTTHPNISASVKLLGSDPDVSARWLQSGTE